MNNLFWSVNSTCFICTFSRRIHEVKAFRGDHIWLHIYNPVRPHWNLIHILVHSEPEIEVCIGAVWALVRSCYWAVWTRVLYRYWPNENVNSCTAVIKAWSVLLQWITIAKIPDFKQISSRPGSVVLNMVCFDLSILRMSGKKSPSLQVTGLELTSCRNATSINGNDCFWSSWVATATLFHMEMETQPVSETVRSFFE